MLLPRDGICSFFDIDEHCSTDPVLHSTAFIVAVFYSYSKLLRNLIDNALAFYMCVDKAGD
jgi:hypothetical protein